MYEIEYYAEDNKIPVLEFIYLQTPKHQSKILREIDLLSEFGLALGMPYLKKMEGTKELWELRIKHSTNNFRIFYFSFTGKKFILLHGIRKTTSKTPKAAIDISLKRINKYIKELNHNES